MPDPAEAIRAAIAQVWAAANHAEALIAEHCPGPHDYVQHRDRKPPWCNACRYTESGEKIPPKSRS